MVVCTWQETTRGPALYIQLNSKRVAFYPFELQNPERVAATAAISLWEGETGNRPRGILARWRWQWGLRKLQRQIAKEVMLHTTE